MTKPKNKKICIVVTSLGGGGAERSSALLSKMLDNLGYEVCVVSVLDIIDYEYKGALFNLGELKPKRDTVFSRLRRLKIFKKYLKAHDFDYVIDSRNRHGVIKEFIISRWLYSSKKTIYCVRSFNIKEYIVFNKLIAKYIYGDAYKVIGVSKAITNELINDFNFKNVQTIYNPTEVLDKSLENKSINKTSYILFYGRIDDAVKNISLLIEGYTKSILPSKNIKLKIMGDGSDVDLVKEKIKRFNLESQIEVLNFKKNPFSIVKEAICTVLTSRYEGFPRVLLESLNVGTPVIAVNCNSGPKELIIDGYNGLLVENHNPELLAGAMNTFIIDKELYSYCKENAKKSVVQFSFDNISLDWDALLKT
jgi:glycosyltransferase involved in cell wall biosynthesis